MSVAKKEICDRVALQCRICSPGMGDGTKFTFPLTAQIYNLRFQKIFFFFFFAKEETTYGS